MKTFGRHISIPCDSVQNDARSSAIGMPRMVEIDILRVNSTICKTRLIENGLRLQGILSQGS